MKKKFQKEANMIQSQTIKNKDLKRRIIGISYKNKLSHIGSCLTAVDIIDEIYSIKKSDERFVLSAGHAHLAHLVVKEKHGLVNIEDVLHNWGIHCDRNAGCDISSGSLGNGLPIAVGMALADRSKNVYCLISDGESSEGSIWEALRIIKEQNLKNLKLRINFNGWGAYKKIPSYRSGIELSTFIGEAWESVVRYTNVDDFPFLKGQEAHYKVMDENEYKQAMEILK